MQVFVQGMGKLVGRATIFSMVFKDVIQRQVGNKGPDDYLFSSERGRDFITRSVTNFFKAVVQTSEVEKEVNPHSLRQSFTAFIIFKGNDKP